MQVSNQVFNIDTKQIDELMRPITDIQKAFMNAYTSACNTMFLEQMDAMFKPSSKPGDSNASK